MPTPLPPEEQTSSSPVTSTTRPIGHLEGPDPGDVVAVLHLDHAVVQPAGLEVLDRHGPGSQEAVASVPRPWCQTPRLKAAQVLDAEQPELRTPTVADRPCADAHLPRPVGLGILPFWVVWAGIEWPFTSSAGAPTLFP